MKRKEKREIVVSEKELGNNSIEEYIKLELEWMYNIDEVVNFDTLVYSSKSKLVYDFKKEEDFLEEHDKRLEEYDKLNWFKKLGLPVPILFKFFNPHYCNTPGYEIELKFELIKK